MFTAEDTDLLLAWQEDLDARCSGCGHYLEECSDPDALHSYDGRSFVCFACAARDAKGREFRDAKGASDSLDGRYFYAIREEDR